MRYWLSFFVILAVFLWFLPVQAQSDEPTSAADDAVVSDVSAEASVVDAGVAVEPLAEEPELEGMTVAQPTAVPSGFGLWWKGVKEKVSIGLTFDPVKKAEKRLQFAEERMRFAELMAQKAEDQKTQTRIHRMIGQAQEMMEKVEARRERLIQQKDGQAQRLLRNIATHQIRREVIMDKIEEKLPEEAVEKFDELREQATDQGRRLLNAINNENAPTETREHLQAIKDRIETQAAELKLFRERRVELMDQLQAGGEEIKVEVKEQLQELRQDRVELLKDRREERLEVKQEGIKQGKLENKLEKVKDGEAVKPLPANKPGAVINKLKDLKQKVNGGPNADAPAPVDNTADQPVSNQ